MKALHLVRFSCYRVFQMYAGLRKADFGINVGADLMANGKILVVSCPDLKSIELDSEIIAADYIRT